jgi:hypothetical protein
VKADGFLAVAGGPRHLELAQVRQEALERLAEPAVVVGDEHAQRAHRRTLTT